MIYLNGTPINITLFPDHTSQVWKLREFADIYPARVMWDFEHEGEVIQLAQLKNLLDMHIMEIRLHINYLPYGRQDKRVTNKSTFALRTFSNILNSLFFDHITILDPHSSWATTLIYRSYAEYPVKEVNQVFKEVASDTICYPDAGAVYKYSKLYEKPYVYGSKIRNQVNGDISDFTLHGNVNNASVLIVDDICDGGATFVRLTQLLKEAGAKEVNMFVTHGIFSKGLKPLTDAGINRIFTHKGEVSEVFNHITYKGL